MGENATAPPAVTRLDYFRRACQRRRPGRVATYDNTVVGGVCVNASRGGGNGGGPMIPTKPAIDRPIDVAHFDPWRRKNDGRWLPGMRAAPLTYECFADLCDDLIKGLENRTVSTDDPIAIAAADRAERTLRSKQPKADATKVRQAAAIDAVKCGLPAFAPAVFAGDRRSKEAVERVTLNLGDHDHETPETWARAVAMLNELGLRWFAYGSPKDGIDGVRRRLLVDVGRDLTPEESAIARLEIPKALGLDPDVTTIGDASRLYFVGAINDAVPYFDGAPNAPNVIDVDALLAQHKPNGHTNGHTNGATKSRYARFTPRVDWTCPPDVKPADHALKLAQKFPPAIQGQHGHGVLFDLACHIVRGLELDPAGARDLLWSEYNPRCVPPWIEGERVDFDRKIEEAKTCKRDAGYLLAPKPAPEPIGVPAGGLDTPIFLRSRDGFVTLIWEGDAVGYRPIADRIITTRLDELGFSKTLVEMNDPKGREFRVDELLRYHGSTYTTTAYAFANRVTIYDRAGAGSILIGYPTPSLPACFDSAVDAWLRALGGPHYDRLIEWIASCAQRHINKLAACLILIGWADVGKSLFGVALARMWGATPPPMNLLVAQFNADLLRCPIVVDEEAQLFGTKQLSTKRFRDVIQAPSRSVERKGKERVELHGALRAVVSCNAYSDLRFDDMGGPAIVGALRDRMLVLDTTDRADECRAALAALRPPGGYFVDLDRLASHMVWLCETVKLPVVRFIGAGGAAAEGAILAGHVKASAEVWERFRDWLDGGYGVNNDVWSASRGLCVNTAKLTDRLELNGRGWDLVKVRAALEPFHVGIYRPDAEPRPRLWRLDAALLAEALGLDPAAKDALTSRLAAADDTPPPARDADGKFKPR
jgi:hypothetical protein